MADQVLKFQPEQKIDSGKPTKKAGTDPRRRLIQWVDAVGRCDSEEG